MKTSTNILGASRILELHVEREIKINNEGSFFGDSWAGPAKDITILGQNILYNNINEACFSG